MSIKLLQDPYNLEVAKKAFALPGRVPVTYTSPIKVQELDPLDIHTPFQLVYPIIHTLAGKLINMASTPWLAGRDLHQDNVERRQWAESLQSTEIKYKRICIQVGDIYIDGAIMVPQEVKENRYLLRCGGVGEFYEWSLPGTWSNENLRLAKKLQATLVVYNPPGVGRSSGCPTREAMVKTYQAMLSFLETSGAKEIIGYSFSMGGAITLEALRDYELQAKGVFVIRETFSTTADVAAGFVVRCLNGKDAEKGNIGAVAAVMQPLTWMIGWNFDSTNNAIESEYQLIVLQKVDKVEGDLPLISARESIRHDDVIAACASLAWRLFNRKSECLYGITEGHNQPLFPAAIAGLKELIMPLLTG